MTATRRRLAGILLSFFLLTVSPALAQHASAIRPAEADLAAATATITPEDSRARVAFLSDDALLGRDTPSPGLDAALAYTAAEFLRMGLQPAGDDGTWLQRYPWVRWRVRPEAARLTVAAGGPTAFVDGAGLAVMPAETGFAGEPVIVGAVTGEAVRLEGIAGQVPVAFVAGPLDREANQRLAVAVRSAEAAGAAGMILVLDSVVGPARMERLAASMGGWRTRLEPLSAALVEWSAARRAFERAGIDVDALSQDPMGTFEPVPLGGAVTLEQPLEEWDARPANALGLLPGSDPALRDELVVVTAHIDHVGVGRPDATGDSIYNGADDNASGTAGMLEIAEAFAALDRAPARSVLFAAVSGEEKGLLGSHWLAERIPAGYRVVANVNLDMISRNAPDTLAVVGQAMSELGPLVQRIARSNPELGFTVVETMNPELPIIRMSDHAAFLGRGVPAVFFNSGLHPDLHRPSDHVEAGDPDKAARAARLAFLLTHAIAELAAPPALTEEGRRWVEQFGVGARR